MSEFHWFEDPIDHVRHRPETYVGSLQAITRSEHTLCLSNGKLDVKHLEALISPVLLKLVDEVVTNAVDNSLRPGERAQTFIKVCIDPRAGTVDVTNDGAGIPLSNYRESKLLIPEVIFTKAFAGCNFNDSEERVTGGRNGIGAKACFIFSTEGKVEIGCADTQRLYTQEVRHSLREVERPTISRYTRKRNYVRILFKSDLKMLTMACADFFITAPPLSGGWIFPGSVKNVTISQNITLPCNRVAL